MKKIFAALMCFMFLGIPAMSKEFKAGQHLTIDDAREFAFEGVPKTINSKVFEDNKFDPNYAENKLMLSRKITEAEDRTVKADWSGQTYIVRYKNLPDYSFTYFVSGKLFHMDMFDKTGSYPHRVLSYEGNGKLGGVVWIPYNTDFYTFDADGKLFEHKVK